MTSRSRAALSRAFARAIDVVVAVAIAAYRVCYRRNGDAVDLAVGREVSLPEALRRISLAKTTASAHQRK